MVTVVFTDQTGIDYSIPVEGWNLTKRAAISRALGVVKNLSGPGAPPAHAIAPVWPLSEGRIV